MKMKFWLLAFLALSLNVMAGEKGNGGDGVMVNGKPYLLDLIEAGVELNPYLNPAVTADPLILKRLENLFPDDGDMRLVLARKLTELKAHSTTSVAETLTVMSQLEFRWVNLPLIDIKDGDTVLDVKKDLVQLAVRQKTLVMIDRNLWKEMSYAHQAALILHETFYAMTTYEGDVKEQMKEFSRVSSIVRNWVGILFSKRLSTMKIEKIEPLVADIFSFTQENLHWDNGTEFYFVPQATIHYFIPGLVSQGFYPFGLEIDGKHLKLSKEAETKMETHCQRWAKPGLMNSGKLYLFYGKMVGDETFITGKGTRDRVFFKDVYAKNELENAYTPFSVEPFKGDCGQFKKSVEEFVSAHEAEAIKYYTP